MRIARSQLAPSLLTVFLTVLACTAPVPTPTPRCWVGVQGFYAATAADGSAPDQTAVQDAARVIEQRLFQAGIASFEVRPRSDAVIEVDLPPLPDDFPARRIITATGDITFVPIPEGVNVATGDVLPEGLVPIMDKSHIATVSRGDNQIGQPALNMTFTDQGAEIFDNYAAANVGHQFAIVVDETIVSAPVINEPEFNGQVQISGPSDPGEFALLLSLMQLPRLSVTLTETLSADVTPPPGC